MAWPDLTDTFVTTEVRTLLGEPTARRFSDAEILRWINKGVRTIITETNTYQTTATDALATGVVEYDPALTDVVKVNTVIYMGGTSATVPVTSASHALAKMHPRHFSNIRSSTSGVPQEYLYMADKLYIWPLPSAGANLNLVKIYYTATREAIAAGDLLLINDMYEPLIIWFAYSEALRKIGKFEQSVQYRSYFDNFLRYCRDIEGPFDSVDSEDMMKQPDRVEFAGSREG